jgi:hypothetical protein
VLFVHLPMMKFVLCVVLLCCRKRQPVTSTLSVAGSVNAGTCIATFAAPQHEDAFIFFKTGMRFCAITSKPMQPVSSVQSRHSNGLHLYTSHFSNELQWLVLDRRINPLSVPDKLRSAQGCRVHSVCSVMCQASACKLRRQRPFAARICLPMR